MNRRLTPATVLMLILPPLLWAGNAVVGRMVHEMVPPILLNFLRWALAFLILLPLAWRVLLPGAGMWAHWRRFATLGLLGVGLYNALQYLALQSSSPINVTLVAASMPVWMLLVGALFFQARVAPLQVAGAVLSMVGVLVVLSRGEWQALLALRLVAGDVFMIIATIVWSVYSWMLTRSAEPAALRADWAAFLLAQVTFGVAWSGLFAGAEWALSPMRIQWSWPLAAALLYVGIGPAIIAFRCWGAGVQRVGPNIASFFNNLTPLFAGLLSSALLGEPPHAYHAVAFALIVGGIVLSSRQR
ncbi:DMT family transporter [Oxalobacteraceae bacterium OM1]|nr:DMT family transporter [Oxalobacteraceae bacterium OM1]